MSVKQLCNILKSAVTTAKNAGVASKGTVQGNMVMVNGRLYSYEVIVPLTVRDGQRVTVQVSAGDNKAYIIG